MMMAVHRGGLPVSRRRFMQGAGVAGLGLLTGCGRWPWQAQQPAKMARIGWLAFDPRTAWYEAFRQSLHALGYVEGQHVVIEARGGDGRIDRLPEFAAELVALPSDVIVTATATDAQAARRTTSTIPIVFATSADPVGQGLVASLARPGGNVTGLSTLADQLAGKRLELLKGSSPDLSRVGLVWNTVAQGLRWQETQAAAHALGVEFRLLELHEPGQFSDVADVVIREQINGLIVLGGTRPYLKQLLDFTAANRLPAMYPQREFVEAGGLMSYAPDFSELFRRTASIVDKILKGTTPANLPVEQPMTFEFVINLKTAQALGLTIPQHVLLQATEIIQ
jgi:putative ABC transport system substrate-binding protein